MTQEPELQTPKMLHIDSLPASIADPGLRSAWDQMAGVINRLVHSLHTDITLGHWAAPIYTTATASNIMEGGIGMENDGTRKYTWSRVGDALQMLTNLPQGYIAYADAIQNTAAGGWGINTWTFPQGGFAAAPFIVGELEVTAANLAHMTAADSLHQLFHTTPSSTQVTFRIYEWGDAMPTITPILCTSNVVWINAIAIGQPP